MGEMRMKKGKREMGEERGREGDAGEGGGEDGGCGERERRLSCALSRSRRVRRA